METAGPRSNEKETEKYTQVRVYLKYLEKYTQVRVYLKYLFYLSFLFPLLLFESISTNHAVIECLKVASCPKNLITD